MSQYHSGDGYEGSGGEEEGLPPPADPDPLRSTTSAKTMPLMEHPATVAHRIKEQRKARKRRYFVAKAKERERVRLENEETKRRAEEAANAEREARKEQEKEEKGATGASLDDPTDAVTDAGSMSISTHVTGFESPVAILPRQTRRPVAFQNSVPMQGYTKELVADVPEPPHVEPRRVENIQKIGSTVV